MPKTCRNCDGELNHLEERVIEVCVNCYRNPETNNCQSCGHHLTGISYPYVCGACVGKKHDLNCWYALDGSFHPSVGVRQSKLHLSDKAATARCSKKLLLDVTFDRHTLSEATVSGRMCPRCASIMKKESSK